MVKSDARDLCGRLKQHQIAVLIGAEYPHIPSNNRAERELRVNEVKQEVSGCFQPCEYAQAYCRISS
ncbi:MAG: hypothetical protein IT514_16060 [Burkholderiales bacterium]|nr:hypothetical protein [Burkholderiales bacterium]